MELNNFGKIWLITDTHFYHRNMVPYCGRPENFTELIIKNWSRMVKDDEITIHLGDVIFGKASNLADILGKIPGRKILIRGNHDGQRDSWYIKKGFESVHDELILRDILFSHQPVIKPLLPEGVNMNIHGHLHNGGHRDPEFKVGKDTIIYDGKIHKLLAIEWTNYKPVKLIDFITKGYN